MSQSEIQQLEGRTLVVCFDGTSDKYSTINSNVVRFFGFLNKDKPDQQLCYYQPGVGTYFNPGVVSPLLLWLAKTLDLAFAWYLDAHVLGGYTFLMENYRAGDKICIFGFSRGACTARALAGALCKVGLLSRDNVEQVPFAYKLYKREDRKGILLADGFKRTFSRDVKIEFLGVWDTVASVGAVLSRSLPLTYSNKAIKKFRHALSLDERRVRFQPDLYHQPAPNAAAAAKDPKHATPVQGENSEIQPVPRPGILSRIFKCCQNEYSPLADTEEEGDDTDVLEVWFSGCHGDIGGGSVPDTEIHSLAHITLRWMVKEVVQSKCGILFDELALERGEVHISLLGESSANEPALVDCDAVDASKPLDDELRLSLKSNMFWWIPEMLPLSYFYQDENRVWQRGHRWNFGRGRIIHNAKPFFHVTVRERIESYSPKYSPNAQWVQGSEIYVN